MSNPFTYYKRPTTIREAQSNVNHWHFEGMLSTDEIEALGYIPASFRTYIRAMSDDAKRELNQIKESIL